MLHQPHAAPQAGQIVEIADGILWTRLALPFRLDHVNIYFLKDDNGWMIVDTGIANRETKNAWRNLMEGPLRGERFSRLLVTHHHPDHIGLAGWLCETLEIPLLTSRTAFLSAMNFYNSPDLMAASEYSRFYAMHGMSAEIAALVSTQGHDYMRMLSRLPFTYFRIADGQKLVVGGRAFEVLTGDGHCPEQAMLHLPEENLFLAADQVIEKITPNISVSAFEPNGNPLGEYLASLSRIRRKIAPDALVLSGHRLPFVGLHERCHELALHHEERCGLILEAARRGPVSAAELLPVLFTRKLSPHETSFAFSETLAHMNHLVAEGELVWLDRDGQRRAARS